MLYELLTGTTPFNQAELKRDGLEELWRMIREVEPPRPSRRVSTLPFERITIVSQCRQSDARRLPVTMQRELDWIVLQAIEKDRDQRYESASAPRSRPAALPGRRASYGLPAIVAVSIN